MNGRIPAQTAGSRGYWFILGAALLWGTTGTAQAFAPVGFDSAVIGTVRLIIGGGALLLLAVKRGELGTFRSWKPLPVLLAAFFIAGYQLFFFTAVARTGVAVGTIVGIGSSPIAGGLFGFLFRGERPQKRWFAATVLAILGCTLLSISGRDIAVDPLGILLAVGAGASYAAYAIAIKGLLEEHAPDAVLAVVISVGAVLLSPALIRSDIGWLLQPRSIAVLLHLGLISMALSYGLFARGLQSVRVADAVTLSLAEPMTAAILGIVVLGERLDVRAFCGIALIFAGLAVLVIRRRAGENEAPT